MPTPTTRPQSAAELSRSITARYDDVKRYGRDITRGRRIADQVPEINADIDRQRDAAIARALSKIGGNFEGEPIDQPMADKLRNLGRNHWCASCEDWQHNETCVGCDGETVFVDPAHNHSRKAA